MSDEVRAMRPDRSEAVPIGLQLPFAPGLGEPLPFAQAPGLQSAVPGTAASTHLTQDEGWMLHALQLAQRGSGWTNPNPLVGAVIVKDGRVIGEGFHERYGHEHAERNALAACTQDPADATIYVTLEPCCHTGKQPPCTDAIIEAGLARVVVGSRDPNPLVAGKGVERLRAAGLRVDEDVLRATCDALNPIFFHYITRKRPYVVAKWAMTLDGKTATASRDARWVSGAASRADVHELRHRLASIMVGVGTVLADDPMLTARREVPSAQPLRVVVDSSLVIPPDSALVRSAAEAPVLVATASPENCADAWALQEAGVQVLSVPGADSRVDLSALLGALAQRGVDSVLLEGGGTLAASFFEAGLVDASVVYIAPKVCGGRDALTPVEGAGADLMAQACSVGPLVDARMLGDDVRLVYAGGAGSRRGA